MIYKLPSTQTILLDKKFIISMEFDKKNTALIKVVQGVSHGTSLLNYFRTDHKIANSVEMIRKNLTWTRYDKTSLTR